MSRTNDIAPPTAVPADQPRHLGRWLQRRAGLAFRFRLAQARAAVRQGPQALGAGGLAGFRRVARAYPERALRMVRAARRASPRNRLLAAAEAVLLARTRGWDAAAPLLRQIAARPPAAAAGLLRDAEAPPLRLALPAARTAAGLPPPVAAGTVVYTAAFGGAAPPPVFAPTAGLRLICLTDREDLAVPGWETAVLAPPVQGPALAEAWCRVLPHLALAGAAPGAEASLWLAPDRWLVGNLATLVARWCLPQPLLLWRRDGAAGWQDLAEAGLLAGTGDATAMIAQAQDCAARDIPKDGAADVGMIWRRHGEPGVQALMQAWWAETGRHPAGLPEVALAAARAAEGTAEPAILPAGLGAAADNIFTARVPAARPRAPRARGPQGGRLPLAFVYAEAFAASASTVLRSRQLGELVAEHDGERFEVSFTSDLGGVRDSVVILSSGALKALDAAAIAAARTRNVAVVGSWDHTAPDPEKLRATDASMTLEIRQTLDFARLWPERPAFLVTHHVNRLIPAIEPPADRMRCGYFGLAANTLRPRSLARLVDLVALDTSNVSMDWIALLPGYNAHWAVRQSKRTDGWKPFLKGFVAARCGAVVVVERDDETALPYLGDDYPFFVSGTAPGVLELDMARIAAAFGGPEWRFAREIMAEVAARSSDAQVAAEFRAMLAELAG